MVKNLTKKEFAETKLISHLDGAVIGTTWETTRRLKVYYSDKSKSVIVVQGRPHYGTFLVHEEFENTPEGFEAAKKFALSGKEKLEA